MTDRIYEIGLDITSWEVQDPDVCLFSTGGEGVTVVVVVPVDSMPTYQMSSKSFLVYK